MTISIAMATYNGEKYLKAQLDSFLLQTCLPDEVVICDDCSSDGTLNILKEFMKAAPFPVRIHRNSENLGYTKNFSKAIELCTEDIIFLSDQDDVWFPEKIATVEAIFHTSPNISIVGNDQELTDENLVPTGRTIIRQTKSAKLSVEKTFSAGCCTAFRKEMRSILLPVPNSLFVYDGWIHQLSYFLGCRVILDQVLQFYRRHGANASQPLLAQSLPVSRWDIFTRYANTNPCLGYQKEIDKLTLIHNRIKEYGHGLNRQRHASIDLPLICGRIEAQQDALRRRTNLLKRNRLIRPAYSILNYIRGDYAYFDGYKSMIFDLIR